ncbi:MAG: sulfurtransferase [Lysobacterales bacterium 69-70]|nr:sulfurtransferase [Xanthomonadaceae bacterium]ODU36060.1 MAG: sulfurtransferase [Xanthomonadaceae bacterium SCN 69-320]ODV18197.1 MAG: sulfurtransferase [Xanthomonadaceae bacterium SCN 69-25]OJY99480.1 MAG: sulfurtransferase [Xanthomonadales bacterium 69-70]
MFTTLISPQDLAGLCGSPELLLVDCRFELSDTQKGENAWHAAHLPNAHYAHLDRDLSDLSKQGLGRHPLPDIAHFAAALRRWGWRPDLQVVAYDDANGSTAARLWWMLRLIGHRRAAVLDGGYAAWSAACLPLSSETPVQAGEAIDLAYATDQIVYAEELAAGLRDHALLLLDARGAARFRGEVEPIDKVAGHIPGARNRPFSDNLGASGLFKHADDLRDEFEAVIDGYAPEAVVHSCGSGVTACHNLLAMEHAGLTGSRIFAPSWSGWIADPARPVARGAA